MKHFNCLQPTETMERISREVFCGNLDELLDKVNKENIGYVITNEGKDDLVLCPAKWFDICYDDDFGCVINSAVRYAIGRNTYMPDVVVRFVFKYLPVLDTRTLSVIKKDIEPYLEDENLPYRATWLTLKFAVSDRLLQIQNKDKTENA